MTSGPITRTVGWVGRHTPPGAGVDGRDAAVIDIAQDLLLRELHRRGVLDALAFKGGTSLRKLYAGNQGRFSLDLDFSVASPADDPDTVLLSLISEIDGLAVGPFAYGVTERRGKWWLTIRSEFATADSALSSKLDVSPPPWLDPVRRAWVPMPVHATYGAPGLPDGRHRHGAVGRPHCPRRPGRRRQARVGKPRLPSPTKATATSPFYVNI